MILKPVSIFMKHRFEPQESLTLSPMWIVGKDLQGKTAMHLRGGNLNLHVRKRELDTFLPWERLG